MQEKQRLLRHLDWFTLLLYVSLFALGWSSILSVGLDPDAAVSLLDLPERAKKQLIWFGISLTLGFVILLLDVRFITSMSYTAYVVGILALVAVMFFGAEVKGAKAWFRFGSVGIQPAEFAKLTTALALARYAARGQVRLEKWSYLLPALGLVLLPAVIIILQNETGSALVFGAFVLVLYREGMPQWLMVLGLWGIGLFVTTLLNMQQTWRVLEVILQIGGGILLLWALYDAIFQRKGSPEHLTKWRLLWPALVVATLIFGPSLLLSEELRQVTVENDALLSLPVFRQELLPLLGGFLGIVALVGLLSALKKWSRNYNLVLGVVFISCFIVLGVDFFLKDVLKPYQQKRLRVLVEPKLDPRGAGYQVSQAKIAIGSGGFWGKGYLQGTQTKFDFVPDQSTDFIFCTVGEEHGWVGSVLLLALFITLLSRLLMVAERQRSRYSRVYAYCVTSILFVHFTVNIGMNIGIFPVIGIPLPFMSYGGSSFLGFTLLLFMLLRLDTYRKQEIVN